MKNKCIALSDMEVSDIENHAYNTAIEIVNQVAEEFGNGGWIPVSSGNLPKRGEIISATILVESQQRRFVSQIMYDDSWLENDWKMIAWKPLDEIYEGE